MAASFQTLFSATPAPTRPSASQLSPSRFSLDAEVVNPATSFEDMLGQASRKPAPKERETTHTQEPSRSSKASSSTKSRRSRHRDDSDDTDDTTSEKKTRHAAARPKHDAPAADSDATDDQTAAAGSQGTKPQSSKAADPCNADAASAAANASAHPVQATADASTDDAAQPEAASADGTSAQKATLRPAVTKKQTDPAKTNPDETDSADAKVDAKAHGPHGGPADPSAATDPDTAADAAVAGNAAAATQVDPINLGSPAVARRAGSRATDPNAPIQSAAADSVAQASAGASAAPALPEVGDVGDFGAEDSLLAVLEPAASAKDAKTSVESPGPQPPTEAQSTRAPAHAAGPKLPAAPEIPPETRFAETNHSQIITGIRGELLPNGGSMNLRLDPPELGDLQISVQMRDGVMTAAFQTSNEQATRLLSHSLGDLKAMLESQGVTVQKLHVEQGPRDNQQRSGDGAQRQSATPEDQQSARRDQQRRDMVQKMWDKLLHGAPMDLVA